MVAGKPWSPVRGKRMRLTRLSASLAPVVGPATTGVSDGFVTVKITPQYDDGDAIQQKNANGDYCVNETADPVLTGVEAEIAFCGVNADYLSMLTGFSSVVDFEAAAVGLRLSGGVPLTNYALEVWTGVASNGAAWGYLLLPALGGGKISEFTVQNGTTDFTVTSKSKEGSQWGTGPGTYLPIGTGAQGATPGKLLTAIGARDYVHLERVTIAPPAVAAGLSALA